MIDGMLKSICLVFGLAFLAMNCQGDAQHLGSTPKSDDTSIHLSDSIRLAWSCTAPFEKVESVVYDRKRASIYVSNGKDYGIGQDGFISKVSMEGEVVDLKWIQNLNRPTGMAIFGDSLYVADVNALLVIDLNLAAVVERVEVSMKYGINDVAIGRDGTVFVTASAIHAVLKLVGDRLEIWTQDAEVMQWANGVQALTNNELWVGGEHLVRVDVETGESLRIELQPRVRDFEGLSYVDAKTMLASTVENSALHLIQNQASRLLLQPEGYFGDLEYIPELNKLIVPEGNHQTMIYSVKCYEF